MAGQTADRNDGSPSFQKIKSPRAFEEIADQIRLQVAQGTLKAGSRLPAERTLAETFGVSRNTLREALRSLENAGLLRLQKGVTGGAYINASTDTVVATGLMDMYHLGAIKPVDFTEARIWLEAIIVREACLKATKDDIARLNSCIDESRSASEAGDFPLRAEKNIEFHRILAEIAGNPLILTVMNAVLDVLRDFIKKIGSYDNTFVLPSRKRFMKHFIAKDIEAATAEMEKNLKLMQKHYLSHAAKSDA